VHFLRGRHPGPSLFLTDEQIAMSIGCNKFNIIYSLYCITFIGKTLILTLLRNNTYLMCLPSFCSPDPFSLLLNISLGKGRGQQAYQSSSWEFQCNKCFILCQQFQMTWEFFLNVLLWKPSLLAFIHKLRKLFLIALGYIHWDLFFCLAITLWWKQK
jgi:hypothetical protein